MKTSDFKGQIAAFLLEEIDCVTVLVFYAGKTSRRP